MIQPNKSKAKSYDDNFLDHIADSDLYKNWSSSKKNIQLATNNAFDTESHKANFDSSNQDHLNPGINPFLNQFVDLNAEDPYNELRAQNQSGAEQLGLGLVRAGAKAVQEVAKIPGVISGLGIATAQGIDDLFSGEDNHDFIDTAFNNVWIRKIDELGEKLNTEVLPVYTAKAVKEGNLWDNISSTAFWATDGADGLGFVLGMMAPGAIFEYAGLGGKLIKGLSNSKRLANLTSMSGKAEQGVSALKAMGITGKTIDSGLAVMGNTILEAGAEAKGVGDDLDGKKSDFIKGYIGTEDHQIKVNKKLKELDQQRKSGVIDINKYNELSSTASESVAEETFKEQRALAMRNTFVSNVGILLGPNAMMHKAIWGKAAQKFEKTAEEGFKGIAKRVGKSAERVGKAFATEGFWEEGSQSTVENMYVGKAMGNELGKDDKRSYPEQAGDMIGDFAKEYVNTLTSLEGQKAIFLGGALGGPMMSYQGRKEDVRNREYTNSVLNGIDKQITHFNNIFDNDVYQKNKDGSFKYKKDEQGNDTTERLIDTKSVRKMIKDLNLTEQKSAIFDFAVKNGDTEVVEKLKQEAIFNLVLPSIHNGEMGIQALEQKLQEDTKFQELLERDSKSDEKDKTKEFVKQTIETAKYLQKQNEKFGDFSRDVIDLTHPTATQEQKDDFLNRLNSSYLNTKHKLRQAEMQLESSSKKRKDIFEELGLDENYDPDAEFPTAKMKNGFISDEDLMQRAEKTKAALESNELLQKTQKENTDLKNKIDKYKSDIADIWKGKDVISGAFNDFIKKDNKETEDSSDETVSKAQEVIDESNKVTDPKDIEALKTGIPAVDALLDKKKKQLEDQIAQQEQQDFEDKKNSEELEKASQQEKNEYLNSLNKGEIVPDPETFEDIQVIEKTKTSIKVKNLETGEETEYPLTPEVSDEISSEDIIIEEPEVTKPTELGGDLQLPGEHKSNPEFLDYMMDPRDKSGDTVSFKINDLNVGKNSDNAIALYNEVIASNRSLTAKEKDLLFKWLPLSLIIEGKTSWSQYPGDAASYSDNIKKWDLRKNIVDLIEQGISLDKITTVVNNQNPGSLNTEKGAINNVLDIKSLKVNGKDVNLDDMALYHIGQDGGLVAVSEKAPEVDASIKESLKNWLGRVFVAIKNSKGQIIPTMLNFKRLDSIKADVLSDIYIYLVKNASESLNYSIPLSKLKDYSDEGKVLYDNIKSKLREEVDLLGKDNDVTLQKLIEVLIHEHSKRDLTIVKQDENGEYHLELKGNRYYANNIEEQKDQIKNDLGLKYHNVITVNDKKINKTDLDFTSKEYLRYIFNNKILNTDVSTSGFTFTSKTVGDKIGSELYITPPSVSSNNSSKTNIVENIVVKPEVSDIQSKKAEIERRREEEFRLLNPSEHFNDSDIPVIGEPAFIVKNTDIEEIGIVIDIKGKDIITEKGTYRGYIKKAPEGKLELVRKLTYDTGTIRAYNNKKEINAKYDAELAALEVKPEVKTNEQKVAEYRSAEKVENSEIEKRKQKELEGYSVQTRMIDAAFQANTKEFKDISSVFKTEYEYPKEITHNGITYKIGPTMNDHFTVTNTETGFETKYTHAAIYNITNPKSTQYRSRQEELDKELAKVEKQYKKELDDVYDKYDKLISPLLPKNKTAETKKEQDETVLSSNAEKVLQESKNKLQEILNSQNNSVPLQESEKTGTKENAKLKKTKSKVESMNRIKLEEDISIASGQVLDLEGKIASANESTNQKTLERWKSSLEKAKAILESKQKDLNDYDKNCNQ